MGEEVISEMDPGFVSRAVTTLGEGCIRERKPTRQLVLQALPIPWTVGGIASGGGADREGAKSPEDLRILDDNER